MTSNDDNQSLADLIAETTERVLRDYLGDLERQIKATKRELDDVISRVESLEAADADRGFRNASFTTGLF